MQFHHRHIGPNARQIREMLDFIGEKSLDSLVLENLPANIRRKTPLNLPAPVSEQKILEELKALSDENPVGKYFIGMGFYPTILPPAIRRNILENPGWYTAYTPYQAEISQGRLEMLLNFQTMISELTGMETANASMLDEGSAAAEAATMMRRIATKKRRKGNKLFIDSSLHPHIIEVLKTRLKPFDFELVFSEIQNFEPSEEFFGAIFSYPNTYGEIPEISGVLQACLEQGVLTSVYSDLMALVLLTPPGDFGADIVFGNAQRFGVPMGFGGPSAAFFATRLEYVRQLPGRLIGISKDKYGNLAYRMTLQTREQHIRREKATSNICTSQVLLANISAAYAVYHGPENLKNIAENIYENTKLLYTYLENAGFEIFNKTFFDTLKIKLPEGISLQKFKENFEKEHIYFRYYEDNSFGISLYEGIEAAEVRQLSEKIVSFCRKNVGETSKTKEGIPENLRRETAPLRHPVFDKYHTETLLMRYLKKLENKDLSLVHSMISLGSCTMKLNAAAELYPIVFEGFSLPHPFVPLEHLPGYRKLIERLGNYLAEITELDAVSFQPNSGAQGEYTGLRVIKAYLEDKGEGHRNIVFIPISAHGTNPASAVMAGFDVVIIKATEEGYIDLEDLKQKIEKHKENLAAMMITYPSTYGIYEPNIKEVCELVHQAGGQVYLDGANMNALVGISSIKEIGGDVCHINLHKTFSIPHGGGGPGMGPIAVAKHLTPYLPSHPFQKATQTSEKNIGPIAAAPFGSASILPISYAYIRMMGAEGLTLATQVAVLNANYLRAKLQSAYKLLYTNEHGKVAHEFIIDLRKEKKIGIDVEDVAKRLIDYGFHAPTVSFPVAGTLMVEPTESEDKGELDRFAEAMLKIAEEIGKIKEGYYDKTNNPLKNAPHSLQETMKDEWEFPYSRETAFFPARYLFEYKYWSPVARIDNRYGDRNIVCVCPPTESWAETSA